MEKSWAVLLTATVVTAMCAWEHPVAGGAEQQVVRVAETAIEIPYRKDGETLLLDVGQVSAAFGWQAKSESAGGLLVLCRNGKAGMCVPVRLSKTKHREVGGALFVDADVLKRILPFAISRAGDQWVLQRQTRPATTDADIPAYNAAWGEGRGFRVGQTLPDIPLYDMQGREVRFSRFLGKQYILYCWASW